MLMAINSNALSNEIAKALSQYTKEIEQGLEQKKEEISKEAVEELKATSPKYKGSYAKGWKVKKVGTARVVYNSTDYQLTHLLENSHALRNGGRSTPQPHIGPVEERTVEKFIAETERMIRG